MENITGTAKDICILGYNKEGNGHDIALTEFLKLTRANRLKIGFDKVQHKVKKAQFFGTTITTDGNQPTDDKVTAIQEMEQLSDVKSLHFLGMVNYLYMYSP